MRIVCLQPYLTDIVVALGAGASVGGITHLCDLSAVGQSVPIVTGPARSTHSNQETEQLLANLSSLAVDLEALKAAEPDIILTTCLAENPQSLSRSAEVALRSILGRKVTVHSIACANLKDVYEGCGIVGSAIGRVREGQELAHRIKAQFMDWGNNFYDRMKGKKVSVLSALAPLTTGGFWIPDLVRVFSGKPQFDESGEPNHPTSWKGVLAFAPDVIVIAPQGASVEQSVKTFRDLLQVPEWEDIPAVKRGAVVFADGVNLFRPGPRLIQGAAVLLSAMAELDSGYVTKRDEFYRLRFVELHRHRFM